MVGRRPPARARAALATALLAALCLAPALRPAVPHGDGTRDKLDAYVASKNRHDDPLAPVLALRELAGHDDPKVVDELIDDLADGDHPERRRSIRRVLEGFREPESVRRLVERGLGHARASVRSQVILALGRGRPDAGDWLAPTIEALDDRDPTVRAAAVEAVGLARASAALPQLLLLADDDSVRVRQRVPEALVRLAPQRALALLRHASVDPSWRVRVSVVRALGALHDRAAVETLVGMLAVEDGRVREDVLRELRRLTRQDFGLHVDAWERYLELAPADFLDTAHIIDGADAGTSPGSVVYYGLSSLSSRFVMITDLSGSMSTHEGSAYRAKTSGTRLAITVAQLEGLLRGTEDDVRLNLVTFSDRARTWQRKLVAMDGRGRARALAEVASYRADGSTNLFEALETCFAMAEESLEDVDLEDDAPDTLFLLTDGEPSVGAIQDVDLLLEWVAERNRDLQLRVHCIALNTGPMSRDFMQRLAQLTTGQYVNPFD